MLPNLLASAFEGVAYLLILFGLCFGSVTGVKYLSRRLRQREDKPDTNETEQAAEKPSATHPSHQRPRPTHAKRTRQKKIYYILERADEAKSGTTRERTTGK